MQKISLFQFLQTWDLYRNTAFSALSHTTSYRFLAPSQNLEKTNDKIPRKSPDRQKDGEKGRKMDRPYFLGPFWLLPGVQHGSTVKPVYNDHLGDEVSVVVIDKWLLYRRPVYNSQNCQ